MARIMTDDDFNNLRILMLEYFSGSSKSLSDMMADPAFAEYVDAMGEAKLRDFLAGLCDPAGLIWYSGTTKNRVYRTTKRGRAMVRVYRGEVELPDPDEDDPE